MKKIALIIISIVFFTCLHAQFGAPYLFELDLGRVYDVNIYDLDGDGDMDVLSASDNAVVWYENLDGLGSFSRFRVIQSGPSKVYRAAFAADMDADGDLDVLSASSNDDLVVWYENMGNGQFGLPITVADDVLSATDVYAADLDGDLDVDIIVASSTSNGFVRVLENTGNAVFEIGQVLPINTVRAAQAVDLDNDGDLDILWSSAFGVVRWRSNEGGLSFGVQPNISTDGGANTSSGLHTVDIDFDGDLDILVASHSDDKIIWLENLGNGIFGSDQVLAENIERAHAISSGDLDGDGDLDIVAASFDLQEVFWFENLGGNTFGPKEVIATTKDNPVTLAAGDIDQDGDPDLVYGTDMGNLKGTIELFVNDGVAQFDKVDLGRSSLGPLIFPFDLDADGDPDLVVGSTFEDKVSWYENLGNGELGLQQAISLEVDNLKGVYAADLDNDGDGDVMYIMNLPNNEFTTVWQENVGGGVFGPQKILSYQLGALFLIFAFDRDGDGDLEVVVYHGLGGLVYFDNLGNGNFSTAKNFGTLVGGQPRLIASDMDVDGDEDLLGVSFNNNELFFIQNDGGGNFTRIDISNELEDPVGVFAADLDNDGDQDAISLSRTDHKSAWYENLGNGNFGPQQIISLNYNYPTNIIASDIDQDGDQDVLVSSTGNLEIVWHENQGGGVFAMETQLIDGVSGFTPVDINVDGDDDLIVERFDGLYIYENFATSPGFNEISGKVYLDENENGMFDAGEAELSHVPTQIMPASHFSYTAQTGLFRHFVEPGTYEIAPLLDPCFELTSGPATYTVDFDGTMNITGLNFGVRPLSDLAELNIDLTSALTRCNRSVPFWLTLSNTGCKILDGRYSLTLSDLANFESAIPAPNEVVGNTLFWDFSDLLPNHQQQVLLFFQIAGANQTGELIEIPLTAFLEDTGGGLVLSDEQTYVSEIRCSYDPNDKLVTPERSLYPEFTENYTLFEEELNYTVRFQNTGNDTAFQVVIRDHLSDKLDWATFRPGASSHPYEARLLDNGLVEFHFNDILLVDATTNEPESHGFVQFRIFSRNEVGEGSAIQNFAKIYFDFNPPIITNTTRNIMVTELPQQAAPLADFSYFPSDLQVHFVDKSVNLADHWLWTFGDGSSSTEQNPSYTYAATGMYEVCLEAGNQFGMNQVCKNIEIALTPQAAFSFIQDMLEVTFTDNSLNGPEAWFWDFGDGETSTEQNPVHLYTGAGDYEICLTVENAAGSDQFCATTSIIIENTFARVLENNYRIIPHPVHDKGVLLFEDDLAPATKLEMFDLFGRQLEVPVTVGLRQMELDLNELRTGLYVFEVKTREMLVARGLLVLQR